MQCSVYSNKKYPNVITLFTFISDFSSCRDHQIRIYNSGFKNIANKYAFCDESLQINLRIFRRIQLSAETTSNQYDFCQCLQIQ